MGRQSRTKRDRRRASMPDPLTQIMRPSCSQCGSPIEWLTTEQAAERGIDLGPVLAFFELEPGDHADVWACTRCTEFGVMGPVDFGAL